MKIVEYQCQLPIAMEEYPIGQRFLYDFQVFFLNFLFRYMVAKASRENSGGGDGIEVIKNEPFEKDGRKGQYTFKVYFHFDAHLYLFIFTADAHCLQST